jgi:hypothetical protein
MAELSVRQRIVGVCMGLAFCGSPSLAADPPKEKVLRLNVSTHKISFDPKTVEAGDEGYINNGYDKVRVVILSRTADKCVFDYCYRINVGEFASEVEQPPIRYEVPIDAGVVSFASPKPGGTLEPSFPKSTRMLYARNESGKGYSVVRALVPGTDEYMDFTIYESENKVIPQKGDKIKFSYQVFDSKKFETKLATADLTQLVEFEMGSDQVWPWLVLAIEGMAVGDERSVQVPLKAAAGAVHWLKEQEQSKTLYARVRLESAERAKK